jgi:hypothetical protein
VCPPIPELAHSCMPWTATITCSVPLGLWEEHVCAENRLEYFSSGREAAVPTADTPDFWVSDCLTFALMDDLFRHGDREIHP